LDFLSPKIGILYTPVDWVQIYANYGRGFSVPMLGAGDYSFFDTEKVFDLSARDQYELGARVYPTDWLDLELAGFIVKTTNDAFYSHVDWSMISNGATTRKGIEAAVNVRPLDNLYLSANYSYIIPKWDKRIDKDLNFKDHFIADLYQHMLNLEVGYAPPAGFGGRLSYHLESGGYTLDIPSVDINGVPVDGPHKAKLQKFDTLDLQLSYRFNDKYRLVFDVTNLLNKKYYGTGYKDYSYTPPGEDFLYTPRPPRLFYLTLEVNWDKS
jgi:outer membrane receptor protein involved in Fe transport